MSMPQPHLDKLQSLLGNKKLPASDFERVEETMDAYGQWVLDLEAVEGEPDEIIEQRVALLNDYSLKVELELVFDSEANFLHRQKGQTKICSSVIEEFLPWTMRPEVLPELQDDVSVGPTRCFSSLCFESSIDDPGTAGHPTAYEKNQDFAISRSIFYKTSYDSDFAESETGQTSVAYVAAELKTNLDKTMSQEACATAHDVKSAVAGSRYYLLCEWLDMQPQNIGRTDIDEVLVLRGAKRLPSNVRSSFSSSEGRRENRKTFRDHLTQHPYQTHVFRRLVQHIRELLSDGGPSEEEVLQRGFF